MIGFADSREAPNKNNNKKNLFAYLFILLLSHYVYFGGTQFVDQGALEIRTNFLFLPLKFCDYSC